MMTNFLFFTCNRLCELPGMAASTRWSLLQFPMLCLYSWSRVSPTPETFMGWRHWSFDVPTSFDTAKQRLLSGAFGDFPLPRLDMEFTAGASWGKLQLIVDANQTFNKTYAIEELSQHVLRLNGGKWNVRILFCRLFCSWTHAARMNVTVTCFTVFVTFIKDFVQWPSAMEKAMEGRHLHWSILRDCLHCPHNIGRLYGKACECLQQFPYRFPLRMCECVCVLNKLLVACSFIVGGTANRQYWI